MRPVCLVLLVGCALLALAAEAGTVQEVPVVVRFRLADPHSPTFYVRWEGHQLRMARSAKEVQTAKPLRPTRTAVSYDLHQGAYFRHRDYAEMWLTGPVGSFTEVLGGKTYSVRAPIGRCTVTTTIDPTPFSKAVTASRQVVVEQQPR